MLIIAIPKSASTSLATSLCELHGLTNSTPSINQLFKHRQPEGVRFLHRYHALPIIDEDLAERIFADDTELYKLHVFPTDISIRNLRGHKKVILLREPREIVLAEKRAIESMIHSGRHEFSDCSTDEDWIRRADELGLYDDLKDFYNRWEAEADQTTLLLYYRELVDKPQDMINRVEEFMGWTVSESVSLRRERYSGASQLEVLLQRGKRLARKSLRKIKKLLSPLTPR